MGKCNKKRSNQAIAKTMKTKNEEQVSQKHIRIQNGNRLNSIALLPSAWKLQHDFELPNSFGQYDESEDDLPFHISHSHKILCVLYFVKYCYISLDWRIVYQNPKYL